MRQGLREAQVEAALGDLDHADLPAKTVAALRLVDLLSVPVSDCVKMWGNRRFENG